MRPLAWLCVVVGILVAGCATSRGDTAFKHPTTGDVKTCAWDEPSVLMEVLCVPCYLAGMHPTGYTDCKEGLEAKGYVMGEATRR